jgi:hypothetical protein
LTKFIISEYYFRVVLRHLVFVYKENDVFTLRSQKRMDAPRSRMDSKNHGGLALFHKAMLGATLGVGFSFLVTFLTVICLPISDKMLAATDFETVPVTTKSLLLHRGLHAAALVGCGVLMWFLHKPRNGREDVTMLCCAIPSIIVILASWQLMLYVSVVEKILEHEKL